MCSCVACAARLNTLCKRSQIQESLCAACRLDILRKQNPDWWKEMLRYKENIEVGKSTSMPHLMLRANSIAEMQGQLSKMEKTCATAYAVLLAKYDMSKKAHLLQLDGVNASKMQVSPSRSLVHDHDLLL